MTRYLNPTAPRATRAPVSRRAPAGRTRTAECDRDKAYDACADTQVSVYSPNCTIALVRTHGRCTGCGRTKDLLNDFCEDCHILGLNERQVMHPQELAAKTAGGTYSASRSPWRMKS